LTPSNRIRSLDRLRAFVVLCVIVLHASLTYMVAAPEWWYVVEPQGNLFFTALVLLLDVPIMPIMFFAAGYFALPSLLKRGPGQFHRDKLLRIGLPWAFGVLVIAPPVTYLTYLSCGVDMTLWQFWRTDFWGDMYQQAVYWFLGVLLMLFAATVVFYDAPARRKSLTLQPSSPSAAFLAAFVGLTAAAFLLLNQYYPLDTWLKLGYLLVIQPLRLPLYIAYFGLGLYAYRHAWFAPPPSVAESEEQSCSDEGRGFQPRLDTWALGAAAFGLLYVSYRLTYPPEVQTTLGLQAANAVLFNAFCFSSLLAGVAWFSRQALTPSRLWKQLAANSYGMYYLHPLLVYPLAYLFLGLSLPVVAKAALLVGLSIALSWAASEYVLRRAPLLRRIFGAAD